MAQGVIVNVVTVKIENLKIHNKRWSKMKINKG